MSAPCPTFGFVVELEFRRAVTDVAREAFWEEWRLFLDRGGLRDTSVRGAGVETRVVTGEGTQATDADRGRAEAWLAGRTELATVSVRALGDVKETA